MEQKEPSVFSPEGSFTFGGVERGENEGEDVTLPQMEANLALCPPPHPTHTHTPCSGHLLIFYKHSDVLGVGSWDPQVYD